MIPLGIEEPHNAEDSMLIDEPAKGEPAQGVVAEVAPLDADITQATHDPVPDELSNGAVAEIAQPDELILGQEPMFVDEPAPAGADLPSSAVMIFIDEADYAHHWSLITEQPIQPASEPAQAGHEMMLVDEPQFELSLQLLGKCWGNAGEINTPPPVLEGPEQAEGQTQDEGPAQPEEPAQSEEPAQAGVEVGKHTLFRVCSCCEPCSC